MNIRLTSTNSLKFSGHQPAKHAGMLQQQPMADSVRFGQSEPPKSLPAELANLTNILYATLPVDQDSTTLRSSIDQAEQDRFDYKIKPALAALEDDVFTKAIEADPSQKAQIEGLGHQVMLQVAAYGHTGDVELALSKGLKPHYDNLEPSPLVYAAWSQTSVSLSNSVTIEALINALKRENPDLSQFPEVKVAYKAALPRNTHAAKLLADALGISGFKFKLDSMFS